MQVPLLDLKAQYQSIRAEVMAAITEVIDAQAFILGPKVDAMEAALAKYCQAQYAIGVSSGTDALIIALMAENIQPGDEVITTPYTFFATAGSIARLGAKPVFVDIDPITFNINPNLIKAKITKKTRAIIPVHLYGQMADMDPIMEIAKEHKLVVIEDACQAIGAEYKGRRAGSIGHYGCFSFFPSKNLGCFGDGGLVTTNDPKRAEQLKILRMHGSQPKYYHKVIGGNFRLDALQAVVIQAKLRHLDNWTAGRQSNADRYDKLFAATGLTQPKAAKIVTPVRSKDRHIFNQYIIRVGCCRDKLMSYMKEKTIGAEIYYPVPLHLQECFAYLGYKSGDFPESERAARETLALPIYPELTDEQANYVVEQIANFCKKDTCS